MSLVKPQTLTAPVTPNTQNCQISYLQVDSTNTELQHIQITSSYNLYLYFHNTFNPLNAELNPICHLLALSGAHYIFHVSGLRVNVIY